MTSTEQSISCLNALLRGELAATETYQQAIAKMEGTKDESDLRQIHDEHREVANALRQHIHECGGQPDQGSGAWGTWSKFVEGTAKLFGTAAALKALKKGEEQGVKDYRKAAKDGGLSSESKGMINNEFLPKTFEHIAVLDRLIASSKKK
jgi:demethoxyubiquinone hydroxylase (CLK1/Coq7/Cat5 family)